MIKRISAAFAALLISTAAMFAQTAAGIVASKTATDNHDGTYTINIEAFVTGKEITSSDLVSTPVDAVLVLDYSYSMTYKISTGSTSGSGPTRLQSLQTAVEQFLKTMKANQDAYNATQTDDTKKITHRVGIVTFNKTSTTRYTLAQGELSSDTAVNNIVRAVKSWGTDYYTRSDLGIESGSSVLGSRRSGATPIMVFFTDGEPTTSSGSSFSSATANAAISEAYSVKNTIGAPVYVVSVVSATGNLGTFMNNVSSNYPSAQSMTNSGARNTSSTNYMLVAPDQAALEAAFESIAHDITSGGATIELNSSTITADIVMSDFQISKSFGSVEKDNIDVYIKKLIGISGTDNYTWSGKQSADSLEVSVADDADGNHVVSVGGFDFSRHWCGYDQNGGTSTMHPDGQKICLDIQLVPNPESSGGFIATNHDLSGIYVNDSLIHKFGVPPAVFAPCDLVIERTGLKPGESAFYKVVRYKQGSDTPDSSFERDIILTAGADSSATAILKADVTYFESGKENYYTYKVIENPNGSVGKWDWNYATVTTADSVTHALYSSDGSKTNIFNFTSNKQAKLEDSHFDEAARNNKFLRLNTTQ